MLYNYEVVGKGRRICGDYFCPETLRFRRKMYDESQRRSTGKEMREMAGRKSNSEVTSKKAASAASKVLRNPNSSKAAKSAAASALTQRPNKK
ncbi:MAG: hypothetical protein OSA47_03225 [Novosphingopyxis baekryungensis]|nr:hypothetical protein [Novosphingopyxis baekryungensis]